MLHKFKNEALRGTVPADAQQSDDVRVMESRHNVRFALKIISLELQRVIFQSFHRHLKKYSNISNSEGFPRIPRKISY